MRLDQTTQATTKVDNPSCTIMRASETFTAAPLRSLELEMLFEEIVIAPCSQQQLEL